MKKTLLLWFCCWLVWAVWAQFLAPVLPLGAAALSLADSVAVKAVVWLVPPLLLLKPAIHWKAPFPWLACLIILCCATAFLHTVRMLNGLADTHVFFDPMFIVFSLSAGVIEEMSFRGCFYASMEDKGFWPAALCNGAMFTLYHYPELLIGRWQGLISLRALLIFAMGVVFCWMYRRWRNLALNMTVHTVWNLLSYLFCLV